jgi:hypothetical protein
MLRARIMSFRHGSRPILVLALVFTAAAQAAAQDRPFLFSIATSPAAKSAVRFDLDVGVGEQVFHGDTGSEPEQRIGIQASRGRLTLVGRVGIADTGTSYNSSQSGEALYSVFGAASPVSLAAGGGILREADGVNVWLARVVAACDTTVWRVHGNLLFQKPISSQRDPVDLITTVGMARRLAHGVSIGIEGIGEDLEGFWDSQEAEGGARLLAGPSLHVAPSGRRWQVTATGGPLFHPSSTGRSSGASRDLPPDARPVSYAFKMSFSLALANN